MHERGSSHGCPGLERLEAILRGTASADEEAHVSSCRSCGDRLDEMRRANRFLERFVSTERTAPMVPDVDHSSLCPEVEGYRDLELHASGGQGLVYRAHHPSTGRQVAIKIPLGDMVRRPSTRYRFQREIELTARLDHPSIVRVFGDCATSDGRLGCVMEFAPGRPIDAWSDAHRGPDQASVRRLVETMREVCDAISYAHQRAILHRDIKPGNVLVDDDHRAHVLDFGLAKETDSDSCTFATQAGAFLGTLAYAAPEQLDGDPSRIDVRTDVHGLGLLLYRVLSGRPPHRSDLPTEALFRSIRDGVREPPSAFARGVDADLDAITLRAISSDPERRYRSAGALRDDLDLWLQGGAVVARFD
ncbi:MAG: serine/threonine protein kinase, partial [Phycisphaerales bacterium]|nr:serine/threonine protein kinase [Phycisphaerales bacterium]